MSAFPEVDAFVSALRAYYHSISLPNADAAADAYETSVEGMYRASLATPATMAHWDRFLQIHREKISFLEKRERVLAAIKDLKQKHH